MLGNLRVAESTAVTTAPSASTGYWGGVRQLLSLKSPTGSVMRSWTVAALGIHEQRGPGELVNVALQRTPAGSPHVDRPRRRIRTLLRSGLGMTRHPQRGSAEKLWLPDSNRQGINELQLSVMVKVSIQQPLASI